MSATSKDSPLQAIYNTYFNGLILHDAADLRWAGNELIQRQGCLMESAGIDATLLAASWENQQEANVADQLDYTVCNIVRSYEYSGLPFDGPQVLLTTQMCGFSRRWLKDILIPSPVVLKDIIGVESAAQRKLMRRQAYAALGAVSMLHPLKRLITQPIRHT